VCETENGEVFISLPVLFKLDVSTPHGVVLKTPAADSVQTVLLVPRIDIDLEIPEDNIHQLPKAISGLFQYIKGVHFDDNNAIFILNPEKLMRGMR
jgi:chemotaxis signal transduction protein